MRLHDAHPMYILSQAKNMMNYSVTKLDWSNNPMTDYEKIALESIYNQMVQLDKLWNQRMNEIKANEVTE